MDGSNNTEKRKQPGHFWQGFSVSVAAWLLDLGLTTLLYSVAIYDPSPGWQHFSLFTGLSGFFGIILGVVWLPVAIIAGFRSLRKGIIHSIGLVLTTFIAAPLVVGCGFSMLVAAFG